MKRIVLVYGLLSGAITGLMFLVLLSLDIKSMAAGYAAMLLASTLIFFGIRTYREQAGYVSFGRALGIGLLIALVSGVIYVIAWAFMYKFLFPDYIDQYAASYLAELQAKGIGAEKIAEAKAEMESFRSIYANPFGFFFLTLIEPLPVGIIVSFISALILKRKPQQPLTA